MSTRFTLIPLTLHEANAFVAVHHRHHRPDRGCRFCLVAAVEGGGLVGVLVVGRPKSRRLQDGFTAEVTRLCVLPGLPAARHAASYLLGAAKRAAAHLGYRRLVTYTLAAEGGASLRAAGWKLCATDTGGGSWSRDGRPRVDTHPLQAKLRWEVAA